jgi:transcriptional regulator with XRE-family HTH domain
MPPRTRTYEQTAHRRAFGDRVRELRRNRDLSQQELAERAGLDRSYVNGTENGHRNVSLDTIDALARALEVEAADLFVRPAKAHGTGQST